LVDLQLLLKIAIKQGTMSEMIELNVQRWLSGNYDANTKQIILDLQANNKEELQDSFYRNGIWYWRIKGYYGGGDQSN